MIFKFISLTPEILSPPPVIVRNVVTNRLRHSSESYDGRENPFQYSNALITGGLFAALRVTG